MTTSGSNEDSTDNVTSSARTRPLVGHSSRCRNSHRGYFEFLVVPLADASSVNAMFPIGSSPKPSPVKPSSSVMSRGPGTCSFHRTRSYRDDGASDVVFVSVFILIGRHPTELELKFFEVVRSFVLDRDLGPFRHVDPVTGYLDTEAMPVFKRIGKPTQLCCELRYVIHLLDITFCHRVTVAKARPPLSAGRSSVVVGVVELCALTKVRSPVLGNTRRAFDVGRVL